ncbi:MAG: sulfite exporter TauE/SafE family protein [Gammaproteobacteria bacterium]|nr:sulfite exporter TauE/SafE family protein [Gammaproteobacteria bacterium]
MLSISFDLLLLLLASGALAGILAGMFGIGGGLLLVPILAMAATAAGMDSASTMQVAVATAMASILLTSLGSMLAHHRRGAVRWRFLLRYAPAVMLGAWLGALQVEHVAGWLDGRLLIYVFVVFAVLSALQLMRRKTDIAVAPMPQAFTFRSLPDLPVALLIGQLSAWLGIGGGSMNAPYFHFRGLPMRTAVGTAAACGYPLALAASIGFALHHIEHSTWPLLGAVFWPGALLLGGMGMFTASLGARLAHSLPELLLKRLFALLLLGLALRLLWL